MQKISEMPISDQELRALVRDAIARQSRPADRHRILPGHAR